MIDEVLGRFGARLHAYCYMTNHIHALIQVGETPLGRLMLRVAGRYARLTQRDLHTTGHLFEKRYYPVLVDADEYLLELLRYIHLNPVRAKMVDSPDQYPWSSHHAYMGTRHESWVSTDFALSLFHADRQCRTWEPGLAYFACLLAGRRQAKQAKPGTATDCKSCGYSVHAGWNTSGSTFSWFFG